LEILKRTINKKKTLQTKKIRTTGGVLDLEFQLPLGEFLVNKEFSNTSTLARKRSP